MSRKLENLQTPNNSCKQTKFDTKSCHLAWFCRTPCDNTNQSSWRHDSIARHKSPSVLTLTSPSQHVITHYIVLNNLFLSMRSSLASIRETARCEVLPPDVCAAKCLPANDGPGPLAVFSCGDFWQVAHCCNGTETHKIVKNVYTACTCSGMLMMPAVTHLNRFQYSLFINNFRNLTVSLSICFLFAFALWILGFGFNSGWIDRPCTCRHHRIGLLFLRCYSFRILVHATR